MQFLLLGYIPTLTPLSINLSLTCKDTKLAFISNFIFTYLYDKLNLGRSCYFSKKANNEKQNITSTQLHQKDKRSTSFGTLFFSNQNKAASIGISQLNTQTDIN
jgi:hypothetical protein